MEISTTQVNTRTQEQRSEQTRGRLLSAAIEVLYQRGYAGTTTTEIADRAGVSRGAMLHHFPTKADLVVAAVEHLFDVRVREYLQAFAEVPADADRVTASVELVWKSFRGPTFYAWLELLVAARTDEMMFPKVQELSRRLTDRIMEVHYETFERPANNPMFDLAPFLSFAVMQGLSLERITLGEDERIAGTIEALKNLSHLAHADVPEVGGDAKDGKAGSA